MRITDLGQSLGFLFNGETKTFNSIKSCDCSELKDNDCIVAMQAQCQQLGYYYYQLAEWGYPFRCGKCN